MQTDELSRMDVSLIAYVVPSKSAYSLLLNNGVARSYYALIADTGRTIDEFHSYCQGSYLQRQVKDAEERQMDCVGEVGRDALRKRVNAKLLELLSMFGTAQSGYRTTDLGAR
jgi:t-SNARE complex subunit (syntaxin)